MNEDIEGQFDTSEGNILESDKVEVKQTPEDERRLAQFLVEHPEHAELIQELRGQGLVGVVDEAKFATSLQELQQLRVKVEQLEREADEVRLSSYLVQHPEHAELIAELRQEGMMGIVDEGRAQQAFEEIIALRKKLGDLERQKAILKLRKEISGM